MVDRMRIMMAHDTIAATIATTTVGKEEARSNPGFFFARVTRRGGASSRGLLLVLSPLWIRGELKCSQYSGLGSCAGLWPLEYRKVRNWQQNKLYGRNLLWRAISQLVTVTAASAM
jgi:hypothetical protein